MLTNKFNILLTNVGYQKNYYNTQMKYKKIIIRSYF